jgi:DNA-binding transcriptional regulator YhcF (GntR family)
MFIEIDESDGVAIYEQVVRQIKYAVASGLLRTGQMIPSVRELARDLRINPNTVGKAYRQLQQDAVIEPVRTTGLVVSRGAGPLCQKERDELIRGRIKQMLIEARRSRLDMAKIREWVLDELASLNDKEDSHESID